MLRSLLLIFTLLIPVTTLADVTLYACIKDGKTTLQNTKDNCDSVKAYHYKSTAKKEAPATSGLRQGELDQLQGGRYDNQALTRRFENVDDRVGWADVNSLQDTRVDRCLIYQRILNDAQYYIAAKDAQDIEIGPTDTARLQSQMLQGRQGVDYYCR